MLFPNRLSHRSRLASFLTFSAITAAGALLAFFRVPHVAARTIWAEDGALFLQEYLAQGAGLMHPYAGYLHFLPRTVVAVVVPLFGLENYPLGLTIACSIAVGLVAALTFHCASALTTNVAARLCWASIPVLVAPGTIETMGNVANLHWYLLWLAPWVLIKSPTALAQKLLLGASALVIGLTEIQTALFLPLIIFRWRDRSLWWAKTGLAAGVACQLFTMWMFPRFQGVTTEKGDPLSVFYGYFLNSSSALVYGSNHSIVDHIVNYGAVPIVASAVPFAAVTLLVALLGNGMQRLAGGIFLVTSGTIWVAAVTLNPAPWFNYSTFQLKDWGLFYLGRYSVIPSMFLLALIPLLIALSADRERPATPNKLVDFATSTQFRWALIAAFVVLQTVHFFGVDVQREGGPEWSTQIHAASQACQADPELENVEIQHAPRGWLTVIPCRDL